MHLFVMVTVGILYGGLGLYYMYSKQVANGIVFLSYATSMIGFFMLGK